MTEERFREYRDQLVWQLREKGIRDEKILEAIGTVPRHLFVDEKHHSPEELYEDVPLAIGQGQTISQPFTVAYMTELLGVKKGDKVLEIGTGSGYQSAVLMQMGATVHTIERQEKLYSSTKERFKRFGYCNINMVFGDGMLGIPEHAPFDKIIVTASSPGIPDALIKQLKVGGTMVVPVDGHIQRMKRVTKISETETRVEDFGHFRFVPLLSGIVMSQTDQS
jgi:protein-L-isoaspartate(D-aspartate) O-methyltransferase